MRFNSVGAQGNYARAGKSAADDAIRTFAAARRSGPDYGKMAQDAANIRSKEKVAMNKIATDVARAGIKAKGDVTSNQIKIDGEMDYRKGKRKAGVLAAAGKFFAATDLGAKGRKKREVGASDGAFDRALSNIDESSSRMSEIMKGFNTDPVKLDLDNSDVSTPAPSGDSPTPPGDAPAPSGDSPKAAPPSTGGGDGTYDGTFQSVYTMAQKSGAKFPELVAAQWQLESAGGTALSGTNNFFGIKAAPGESGTVKSTWEEDSSGNAYDTSASFKNFDSPQASVDHLVTQWHKDYKNYRGANNSATAADAARYLRSQGYATDSKYADKLIDIMSRNGF